MKQIQSSPSDSITEEDNLKNWMFRVYKNGSTTSVDVTIENSLTSSWPEIVSKFQDALEYPVSKIFTTQGKKLSSVSGIRTLSEIVVCGKEPFKLMPYGKEDLDKKSTKPSNRQFTGRMRRHDRENIVKSVYLDSEPGEPKSSTSMSLTKTLSEQDVCGVEKSPKIRSRTSHSPKPRPLSAYHQTSPSGPNSADRRSISRIPKRIINHPLNQSPMTQSDRTINSPSNATPAFMSKSLKGEKSQFDRPNRTDSNRDFIRPKLVTVIANGIKPRKMIRFLLNKKTARSLDQVLTEVTESLRPNWGAVRKLFTKQGQEIIVLEDLFGEEDVYIAAPNDKVSIHDFILDNEEKDKLQSFNRVAHPVKITRGRFLNWSPAAKRKSDGKGKNSNLKSKTTGDLPKKLVEKYEIGRIIGHGNFAIVKQVTHRDSNINYAMKVINTAQRKGRDCIPEMELRLLAQIQHPNVVKLYEIFKKGTELFIILELVEGGDLFDLIAKHMKFSEKESKCMTFDVASAIEFLHLHNIVHRDIKPENLLVFTGRDGQRTVKLADFGLARFVDGPLRTVCGTPIYVAPEILTEEGYDEKVDVWALGVIIYVLLCGYPPFVSLDGSQETLFDAILSANFTFPDDPWESISDEAKDLIAKMLVANPFSRLASSDILEHPWLFDCDKLPVGLGTQRFKNLFEVDKLLDVLGTIGDNSYNSELFEPETLEFY